MRRAIEQFAGLREVFGNDLERKKGLLTGKVEPLYNKLSIKEDRPMHKNILHGLDGS